MVRCVIINGFYAIELSIEDGPSYKAMGEEENMISVISG
jgi:hypothetical protein